MRVTARPAPGRGQLDHELLGGLFGTALLACVHLGPSPSLLRIPCFFKALTHLPCPSCGMTRCWEALGRLEWAQALRMHPAMAAGYFLLWAYVPYAAGALGGLWPRLGISLSPSGARAARISVLASFAALWGFLIWDGR